MELVWAFSNDSWTNVTPTSGNQPGALVRGFYVNVGGGVESSAFYDPALHCDAVFVAASLEGSSPDANWTWEFCSSGWTRGPENPGAFYNDSHGVYLASTLAVYDSSLAGGLCILQTWTTASTWLFTNDSWESVAYNGTPPNYRLAGIGVLALNGGYVVGGLESGLVYDAADATVLYLGGWYPAGAGMNGHLAYVLGVSPLFVRLSLSPDPGEVGGPVTVATETVGGAGLFNYSYTGLPTGCDAFDRSSFGCVPGANGTYRIQVTVTDRLGQDGLSAATLVVGPGVQTQLTIAPDRIELGQSANVSLAIRGGLGPYWVGYSGVPSGCTVNVSGPWVCTPSTTGNFTIGAQVLDTDGVDASVVAWLSVVPRLSSPTLTVSRSVSDEGIPLTLAARVTGGLAPLSYSYRGLPTGCTASDTPTIACLGTLPGNYTATVRITDALGVTVQASARWTVAPPLSGGLDVSRPPYFVGQPLTLAAHLLGGTPPYSVQWDGVPGALNQSGDAATWTPDEAGRFTVTALVTDSGGGATNASLTLSIQVPPAPYAGSLPIALLIGLAAGGAALVAAATILVVRRRGGGRS